MFSQKSNTGPVKNPSHNVVLPFYIYAALAFAVSTALLFTSSGYFSQHYFQPKILAITHTMALGWGTMIILGSSYQLLPVLIERKLYSNILAHLSFLFAGIGIPMLVCGFYTFNMRWPAQYGALLIDVAIILYLVNVVASFAKSKQENIHALFMLTAGIWLFITILIGSLLVYNFTYNFLPKDSLHYLSLHAHLGIAGWFLLLVMGVGTRLIPMFLVSGYNNKKILWWMYGLTNAGLISFAFSFLYFPSKHIYLIDVSFIAIAVLLFVYYCRKAYLTRIRRQTDAQMKVSLLAVIMMVVPLLFLVAIISILMFTATDINLVTAYGFTIFFGWLTAIILGMTFKTLPFIIWNKTYHARAGLGRTPNPKDLFSAGLFNGMALCYLTGFVCFVFGIMTVNPLALKGGAALLICCAFLYNANVAKLIFHKPGRYENSNK
ncbi:MAG: cytochrome C oxidase subunit I [Chitinophagaceae bacterium]|nr:cytochrome C oxidase subunit I [Chitinophagaceae bacterium]